MVTVVFVWVSLRAKPEARPWVQVAVRDGDGRGMDHLVLPSGTGVTPSAGCAVAESPQLAVSPPGMACVAKSGPVQGHTHFLGADIQSLT